MKPLNQTVCIKRDSEVLTVDELYAKLNGRGFANKENVSMNNNFLQNGYSELKFHASKAFANTW